MILTYKFRIKDSNSRKRLEAHARAVNFVWNYCCEVQRKAESNWRAGRKSRWPTHFDLTKLTAGTGRELGIGSESIGEVCRVFAAARNANRRSPKFRSSKGSRRSLGWIPFRGGRGERVHGDVVKWYGEKFRFWCSREIPDDIRTGSFVQDARGRWYVTFQCEVSDISPAGRGVIGVDLGLKNLATMSDGAIIPAMRHYRKYEEALGKAQRAKNKRRAAAISAKIANSRRHHLHVESAKLARENKIIVVGNVNAAGLKQTKMAKSVSDAGWTTFRIQLRYKASRHGAVYIEADERFTSQVCSCCGVIPDSSPKGIDALGVRHWVCNECGSSHDRDLNAARNILRVGLECQPPLVEIAA